MKLCALHILAGAGVDTDKVALVDEEGYADLCAGFDGSGLGCVGSGVACEAGIGLSNSELNKCGGLYAEYLSFVRKDLAGHIFLNELEGIAKLVLSYGNHLVGFGIHKVVKSVVVIGIFHILSLNESGRIFVVGVEGALGYASLNNVSDLSANECGSLTGLYVLKLDYLINVSVHFESYAVSEISC